MSLATFFANIIKFLTGEVEKIPSIEKTITTFADKVTNDLKVLTGSDLFKYLEEGIIDVAKVIDPALVPLIAGIENYIPKAIALIGGIDSTIDTEAGKTVQQQASDALQAIQSLKGVDVVVYSGKVGTLATCISNYVLTNNAVETGVIAPPAGTLLSVQQVIHAAA